MYQSISFFEKINLYATLKEDLKKEREFNITAEDQQYGRSGPSVKLHL